MTETAIGAAVDLTDATDHARALMLDHADAPFRNLADHLPIGVFLVELERGLIYANRHLVENLWARLKEWRAIATRYEKRASSFMSVLCLAATLDWIKD